MWQPLTGGSERRGNWRYSFDRTLQFRVERKHATWLGVGRSIELGAGGLLFHTDCPLSVGENLEVQIAWPLRAQGVCPVVLVIRGTVLRTDARGTALRMRSYMFQMEGDRSFESPANNGVVCNLIG